MQGFSGAASRIGNLPIGVGIATDNLSDGKVMIRVNEGIVVPHFSIISANQMRSFGTIVVDTLVGIVFVRVVAVPVGAYAVTIGVVDIPWPIVGFCCEVSQSVGLSTSNERKL